MKRPAAAAPPDVLRSARAVLLGAIGRPGEPGTVRAIGRRAVVSAVNNGGRWVLASAIRILDGEARRGTSGASGQSRSFGLRLDRGLANHV